MVPPTGLRTAQATSHKWGGDRPLPHEWGGIRPIDSSEAKPVASAPRRPPMPLQRMKHLVPALVLVVALSSFLAEGVAAATPAAPSHDVTHPGVMQQAALGVGSAHVGTLQPFTTPPKLPAIGGAGGPLREVFGFALASSLGDPSVGYPSWNFSMLTTVAFFGLHVQDNGTFAA